MSWMSSRPAGWDIYARELATHGHGHPLWGPEPSLESGEVQLGDVGYLRKGYFCFLFNCMRPADDPVNAVRGVPKGFEVFEPPDGQGPDSGTHRQNVVMPPHLLSGNIESWAVTGEGSIGTSIAVQAGGGIHYHSTQQTGALLLLKQPGHETYLECETSIMRYMKKHLQSWYDYIQSRGLRVKIQDLLFVSGFVKTSTWAVGSFRHRSSSGTLRVSGGVFSPGISGSGNFSISMSACRNPEVFHRSGPLNRLAAITARNAQNDDVNDQCIFLQYLQMKPGPLWRLRAAAGPHELPPSDDDEDASSNMFAIDHFGASKNDSDAVGMDHLLDYILQNSNAEFACASSKDSAFIFQKDCFPDDLPKAIDQLSPYISVDSETGIASLIHRSITDRKQEQAMPEIASLASLTVSTRTVQAKTTNQGSKAKLSTPSQHKGGFVLTTSAADSEKKSDGSVAAKSLEQKANTAKEAEPGEAEDEVQKQRITFVKLPKHTYSNFDRPRASLLTQLLTSDPELIPSIHSRRTSHSTDEVTQGYHRAGAVLLTNKSSPAGNCGKPQQSLSSEGPFLGESDESMKSRTMQGLAQDKVTALAAPIRRRHSDCGYLSRPVPQQQSASPQQPLNRPLQTIPFSLANNPPAPIPSMTPRATRRQMLQAELSESLRRNLLWERQVNRMMLGRGAEVLGSGSRLLSDRTQNDGLAVTQQGLATRLREDQVGQGHEAAPRRRAAMVRNRSWDGTYNYSGR